MYGRKYGEESDSYDDDRGHHGEKHGGYIKKSYIPVPYTINVRCKPISTRMLKFKTRMSGFREAGTNAWDRSTTIRHSALESMCGIAIATAT